MAAPTLAIVGRGEQAVDQLLVGIGRRIGHEAGNLFGRRRQSDQIERGTPDERRPVGIGRKRQSLFAQPAGQHRVDRSPHSIGRRERRDGGHRGGLKGPIAPLFGRDVDLRPDLGRLVVQRRCAGSDPGFDSGDLLGRHFLLGRGHFARPQLFDQQAFGRVARNDRRPGLAPLGDQSPQSQVELAFVLGFGSVAIEAKRLEDRPHVFFERQRWCGGRCGGAGVAAAGAGSAGGFAAAGDAAAGAP